MKDDVRGRLVTAIQASVIPTGAWKSAHSGWACNSNDSGHRCPRSEDEVDAAELSMTGASRCVYCGEDITWEPSAAMKDLPEAPPLPAAYDLRQQGTYAAVAGRTLMLDARLRAERALIAETERKMVEGDPPPPLPKREPDGEASVVVKANEEQLRRFRALHGRAPNRMELEDMLRKP